MLVQVDREKSALQSQLTMETDRRHGEGQTTGDHHGERQTTGDNHLLKSFEKFFGYQVLLFNLSYRYGEVY